MRWSNSSSCFSIASQRAQHPVHALDLDAVVPGQPRHRPLLDLQLLAAAPRSASWSSRARPRRFRRRRSRRAWRPRSPRAASRASRAAPRSSLRMSRTGPLDVLGPDLLLGARHAVVLSIATSCASSDWISTFSSEAWRSISRKRSFIVRSCATMPSAVVGRFATLPLEAVAFDRDRVQRLALLGREHRVDDAPGSFRANFCRVSDQLVHHLDRLRPLRRQVREDARPARGPCITC